MILVDLSKWNIINESKIARLKKKGCNGAIIQLSAGVGYPNNQAEVQLKLFRKYFGWVGAYHYFYGNVEGESKEFISYLKKWKIPSTAPVAIDIEDSSLQGNQVKPVNSFLDKLRDAGYHNLYTYSMASWFWGNNKLTPTNKIKSKLWVANPDANSSQVANTSIFQFTFNWENEYLDANLTYDSFEKESQVKVKTNYLSEGHKFKVTTSVIRGYNDLDAKQRNGNNLTKGSTFHAKPVKIGKSTYRLESKLGYFTANDQFVTKVK